MRFLVTQTRRCFPTTTDAPASAAQASARMSDGASRHARAPDVDKSSNVDASLALAACSALGYGFVASLEKLGKCFASLRARRRNRRRERHPVTGRAMCPIKPGAPLPTKPGVYWRDTQRWVEYPPSVSARLADALNALPAQDDGLGGPHHSAGRPLSSHASPSRGRGRRRQHRQPRDRRSGTTSSTSAAPSRYLPGDSRGRLSSSSAEVCCGTLPPSTVSQSPGASLRSRRGTPRDARTLRSQSGCDRRRFTTHRRGAFQRSSPRERSTFERGRFRRRGTEDGAAVRADLQLNPSLWDIHSTTFRAFLEELRRAGGTRERPRVLLGYHGTPAKNTPLIMKGGFCPRCRRSAGDGAYFSGELSYAVSYAQKAGGHGDVLLCALLAHGNAAGVGAKADSHLIDAQGTVFVEKTALPLASLRGF